MRYDGSRLESRAILRISIADMVALRVRTKEPDKPFPDFLYQWLPTEAMSLIETLPTGTAVVSIPQQNGRYPISRVSPESGNGYVIVFSRQPNSRYEATHIRFRNKIFKVAEFHDESVRWAESHSGSSLVNRRHAYFAPTREQWSGIQRDGGFAIFDSSIMSFAITPKLLEDRKSAASSGITCRMEVREYVLSGTPFPVPAFSSVELTFDEIPKTESGWINFVEVQRLRSIQSRPPAEIVPPFREWLRRFTQDAGFISWSFRKGMFFGDHIEWWGDRNRRRTTHEGIDFIEGHAAGSETRNLPEGTPVYSIADGELIAALDDFLNTTLLVRHSKIRNEAGAVFYTLLSHIQPETCDPGPVVQGQLLGKVVKARNAGAPAHLHLTGAWIPEYIGAGDITMDMINAAFMPIALTNFNSLLGV